MNGFGMKLREGMNVPQIDGGRARRHRVCLRFLMTSALTAILLAWPLGSLPAAQVTDITPYFFSGAQGKPNPLFNGALAAEIGQQKVNVKIAPGLQRLIAQSAAVQASAGRFPQTSPQDRIKVMFHLTEGTTLDPSGIASRGGRVLRQRKNLVAAEIPPDQIENVIDTEKEILFARLPHRFHPLNITSEGVGLTGTGVFHSIGYRGAGIKVAVVDIGFKGLTQAINTGDLPVNVIMHDFTGKGLETQYKHGTACAEIVHDMAPDAELHLLKIAEEEDFYAAYDYCLKQGINIISLSLVTFGSGPGNGTGPIDELCDEARANGILVVGGAGNAANTYSSDGVPLGTHWEGVFSDGDDDNVHEFSGQKGNIILAMPKRDDDGNPEHDEVDIRMRWDDWQTVTTDYDMYLYYYDYQSKTVGGLAASSASLQNGPPQLPREEIEIDLPDTQEYQFYYLQVTKKPGSNAGGKLEIALGGNCYFIGSTAYSQPIATSSGSIMEPADAASVFAVGAINYANWNSNGPQEDFSSQGPTNAWAGSAARIKPDICGPDRVSSNTYGASFPGTSAATPHVAGAAALLWSLHPNLLPGEVQSSLESWALDMGDYGKDNLYGWGKLQLISHTLSIYKSGSGTIAIIPSGINCDSYCSVAYPSGINVTLTATPDYGFTFEGWSGIEGCSGTGPCTLTMDSFKYVNVRFDRIYHNLSISMAGTGIGMVKINPSGMWCYWNSCSNYHEMGLPLTLTAEPLFGSAFTGWSGGGCWGIGTCTVNLNTDTTVTATFLTTIPIAYIPNFAADTVSIINTSHNLVVATINVGDGPHSVAVDPSGTRVYIGNLFSNDVSVIDTLNKRVMATIPVGNGPYGVAANPSGTRLYVANNGSNSVSVVDTSSNTVVATIPVGSTPYGIAVNSSGTRAYAANNGSNSVSVIDTSSNTVAATIPVGNAPTGVAFNQAGTRVFVTNNTSDSVSVIDTSSNTVVATVTVGNAPYGVVVNPAGTRVYTTNYNSSNVSVIDTSSNTVIATVPVGNAPSGISGNPAGTRIYVTNYGSNDISVIDTSKNEVIFPNLTAWNGPFAFGQFISVVALKGDLNDDGIMNIADAILAMQVMCGMHPSDMRTDYTTSGADLSGNNKIGLEEAIYIMQTLAVVR
jgi:YVTN family beta-propeller protein